MAVKRLLLAALIGLAGAELSVAQGTTTSTSGVADPAWGYYPTRAFELPASAASSTYLTPDTWSTRFPICGGTESTGLRKSGNLQSPIDLSQVPVDLDLKPLNMRTYLPFTEITIQAIPQKQLRIGLTSDGDSYTRDPQTGIQYVLKYIDVRSPSEHTFGGSRRDLEIQFIHTAAPSEGLAEDDPRQTFAISATYLVGEGSKSGFLDALFVIAIPYLEQDRQMGKISYNYTVSRTGAVADMPPISRDYFRYQGSMTYPPCTENHIWNVYANPIYMSKSQLNQIRDLIGLPRVDEDAVYNISGETGAGSAMKFTEAVGNARCLAYVPESLQPLLDESNIYSEQKYAVAAVSGRKRLYTQTEIRGVTMFKDYVGDEWIQHKVESLPANDAAFGLAVTAIVSAVAGIGLGVLAFMITRA